ncbi:hypothetical protein D9615_005187 [Tricholomella constricta]|uniref:Uncharacterized protein n=1 Tax=Tricholomella constricta TaxID=117010 RepID=A0A8H5M1Z8_9AGAR|nr:hypothetical protein D9615_005187 [Tricholomella constricta]
MPAHTPYPNPSTNTLHPQHEEFKASYDNLIDEFAKPFTATSNHQTFAVDTPIGSHRRGPSFPLNKSFESSKQSDDTSHEPPPNVSYPPLPVKETDTRSLWQKILPESLACRLYVITVLIETTIDLAIEGELLLRLRAEAKGDSEITSRKMPVYLSIFALAHVFQLVMAIDAVYARNTLQFMCLTVFNALFLVYAIIQIKEIQEALSDSTTGVSTIPINVLTTIIPVVISVSEIAYIGLGWKIYNEFGWKVYKFIGADRRIKKMYANYQIYECLVKFDVFFWVGFSVQFIWLVLQKNDWEYYVTCAALPLSIVLLVEGHLAARHENKWMMATFMSGCIGAMLIKVLLLKESEQFKYVWKSLTVFSIIAIVLLIMTMALSVIVMRDFGRGLKDALERKSNPTHGRYLSQAHRRAASTNLNRMSIN